MLQVKPSERIELETLHRKMVLVAKKSDQIGVDKLTVGEKEPDEAGDEESKRKDKERAAAITVLFTLKLKNMFLGKGVTPSSLDAKMNSLTPGGLAEAFINSISPRLKHQTNQTDECLTESDQCELAVKRLCCQTLFSDEGWKRFSKVDRIFDELGQSKEGLQLKYNSVFHPTSVPVIHLYYLLRSYITLIS